MRHAVDHRKLGRSPSHRKALLRNLMNAIVSAERVETTVARAKELRRLADRLVTLGKKDSVPSRRQVFAILTDKENTAKVFETLAPRFVGRAGGYTRILRTGYRVGDGAEMAIIEYLPSEEKKAGAKSPAKKPVVKKTKSTDETATEPKPRRSRVSTAPKTGKADAKPARVRATKKSGGE